MGTRAFPHYRTASRNSSGTKEESSLLLPDAGQAPICLRHAVGAVGGRGSEAVTSCAILTTEANEVLRPVHDRMPVILHPEDYRLWRGGGARELDLLKEMLRPYPAEEMIGYPVSTSVNSPRAARRAGSS